MKIYSCLCTLDMLFPLTSDEIIDLVSNCSLLSDGFMILETEDELYIFCTEIFDFCYNYYKFLCLDCYNFISFAFSNICEVCIKELSICFSNNLFKLKNEDL